MTERYQSVNGSWPEAVPPLTEREAITAAKRLYRFGVGKPFKGKIKIVTGNRRTRIRWGILSINLQGHPFFRGCGWKDLVHYLSHYAHWVKHPEQKPHDGRGTHAFLEKEMVGYVIKSGWLEGKLRRPEKPKANIRDIRHKRILARMEAWETKLKRAERALKKLRRQNRYYQV